METGQVLDIAAGLSWQLLSLFCGKKSVYEVKTSVLSSGSWGAPIFFGVFVEFIQACIDFIWACVDFFLHLDQNLTRIVANYGVATYAILFVVIFCETGLVVTPLLPGDSLLFAIGTITAIGQLNVWTAVVLLAGAAILGDTVNYAVGKYLGPKVFHYQKSRFFNPEHLRRAHAFYEKYGGKTIIIARFIPIIRTFAPFVAGIGAMTYRKFIAYNIIGGVAWVLLCVFSGYYFGNIPFVKKHFELVILAIIFISLLPALIEFLRQRNAARAREA